MTATLETPPQATKGPATEAPGTGEPDRALAAKLLDLLARAPIPLREVAALLDDAPARERPLLVRAVPGALQAKLFDAAAQSAPLTVDDIVPPETPALVPVIHFGRNSLPLFSLFEKRFCRPEPQAENPRRLYGYNHHAMAWVTGPGSMVAYDGPKGEVIVDYRQIPAKTPHGWPLPAPNDRGLAALVYGNLVDHLRRVSAHVSIGKAFRGEDPEENYFILCREA